jgi:hypothetical protein
MASASAPATKIAPNTPMTNVSWTNPRKKLVAALNAAAPLGRRNGLSIARKLPWEPLAPP